ncbi:MAG: hypothetical protein GXY34_12925 [Syntrophomonadaceae bacterium]|nr:hypothetical protein [Syntrophomonadaceae bacterium]
MKTRNYLVLADCVKRIGVNSVKSFPDLALKRITALIVFYDDFDGVNQLIRLYFTEFAFDKEGHHCLDEIDYHRISEALGHVFDPEYYKENKIAYMSLRKKTPHLSDIQKAMINQRLERDFRYSWTRYDPYLKSLLWTKGDTEQHFSKP